jgi:hypothetical protein
MRPALVVVPESDRYSGPLVLPVGSRRFRRLDVSLGNWIRRARQKAGRTRTIIPNIGGAAIRDARSGAIRYRSLLDALHGSCCWTPLNVVVGTWRSPFVADPADSRLVAPLRDLRSFPMDLHERRPRRSEPCVGPAVHPCRPPRYLPPTGRCIHPPDLFCAGV